MIIKLFGSVIDDLERGLALASRRHEVVTRNIANIDTPGYRAQDVVPAEDFRTALRIAATNGTATDAITTSSDPGRLVVADDGPPNATGNDVNLDRQMARLAENTLFHQALVQILSSQFSALQRAIDGR